MNLMLHYNACLLEKQQTTTTTTKHQHQVQSMQNGPNQQEHSYQYDSILPQDIPQQNRAEQREREREREREWWVRACGRARVTCVNLSTIHLKQSPLTSHTAGKWTANCCRGSARTPRGRWVVLDSGRAIETCTTVGGGGGRGGQTAER